MASLEPSPGSLLPFPIRGSVLSSLTHEEIPGWLYHGTLSECDEVSYITAPDEEAVHQLYKMMSGGGDIDAMINPRLPVGWFGNVEQFVVCIDKVESLPRWLIMKKTEFAQKHGEIGEANLKSWISHIEEDVRTIFRQIVAGISDFWEKKLLPHDLRYSICLRRGDTNSVRLIPSLRRLGDDVDGVNPIHDIVDQLRDLLSKFLFPHLDDGDQLSASNCAELSLELRQFCMSLGTKYIWDKVDPRFALAAPFFWSMDERAGFIEVLHQLMKGIVFPKMFWRKAFALYMENDVVVERWSDYVPDGVLRDILESHRYTTHLGSEDIVRFTSDVLWDYIDFNGFQYICRDDVMQRLMKAFPWLFSSIYLSLFAAIKDATPRDLVMYEKGILALKSTIKLYNL